jgi:hypothetical protein
LQKKIHTKKGFQNENKNTILKTLKHFENKILKKIQKHEKTWKKLKKFRNFKKVENY